MVDSLKVASLACLDCSSGIKEQVIIPKVHACSHRCSLHAIAEVVITCSSDPPLSHNLTFQCEAAPRGHVQSRKCTDTAICLQYLPEGYWWEPSLTEGAAKANHAA